MTEGMLRSIGYPAKGAGAGDQMHAELGTGNERSNGPVKTI